MKYVVVAEPRFSGNPQENMAGMKNLQEVFTKWEAPKEFVFLQFVERIDGQGAIIVFECDDPAIVAEVAAGWAPWVHQTVHPVIDVEAATAASQKAIDWHDTL
jgi:hypothetical protein